jgi:hypothetical protein
MQIDLIYNLFYLSKNNKLSSGFLKSNIKMVEGI